jgi:hypothetical protein
MRKLHPLAATAIFGLVTFPASAGAVTVGTLPPVTAQAVNNGPGNQTDPHVSGDLLSYTSKIGALFSTAEIRYQPPRPLRSSKGAALTTQPYPSRPAVPRAPTRRRAWGEPSWGTWPPQTAPHDRQQC